jgi:predicted nuclease of predicted toxin-antitoxin system
MKILLDENLPHALRSLLTPRHDVSTVSYMGWSTLENGSLLSQAASNGFDASVTKDQGLAHEQNLANLPLAVVVLQAKTNKIDDIRPLVSKLLWALDSLTPRSVTAVG